MNLISVQNTTYRVLDLFPPDVLGLEYISVTVAGRTWADTKMWTNYEEYYGRVPKERVELVSRKTSVKASSNWEGGLLVW